MHYSDRGAMRSGTGWHTLYCVYVTSRRLNLHAARERAMKYSRRRHGRHATCARTMHHTGFECCCVPFFDLSPIFSQGRKRERERKSERGRDKFRFYYASYTFHWRKKKPRVREASSFIYKNKEERITRINLTNRYNTMNEV